MSSDTTTLVVTPSQSHEVNDLTQRTNNPASSKTKKKTTLPNIIIHIDPLKYTSTGELAINSIIDILEKQGYDNCFGHKKKGQFFRNINMQLHAPDGPLSNVKKTKDMAFQKKIMEAFNLLDSILEKPHSSSSGDEGEEWPPHLSAVLYKYRSIKLSSTADIQSKTIPTINLEVQRSLIPNLPSTGDNTTSTPRHPSRIKNVTAGHELVVRGDNTHDASGNVVTSTTNKITLKKKKGSGCW